MLKEKLYYSFKNFLKKYKNKRWFWFFAFSILCHGLFFVFISNVKNQFLFSSNKINKLSLWNIQPEQKKKSFVLINLPKIQKKSVDSHQKKQIVNNELEGEDKIPLETRFLGEKNQVYKKQTIAKEVGVFSKSGSYGKKTKNAEVTKILKTHKPLPSLPPTSLTLKDLAIHSSPTADSLLRSSKASPSFKEGQLSHQNNEHGDRGHGLARNNDYIEDVPLGDATHLNTVQFKYFGYYARIRGQLEQFWGLSIREKAERLNRRGRQLNPRDQYITSLKIHLDERGNILRVIMLNSSGEQDLDDAAIESFKKAGPFPNPPKGMVTGGVATIEWGFVVKS